MPWTRRREFAVAGVAGACVVVTILLLLTVVGGWAPLLHWTCKQGSEIESLPNFFLPAVIVDSPYGGSGWGNGTVPATFPGAVNGPAGNVKAVAFGTGALNGQALGAFFTVNLTLYTLANATQWGPGSNTRCSAADAVEFSSPLDYIEAGGAILGPNNTTDNNEPHTAILPALGDNAGRSPQFNASYLLPDEPSVTTCASGAQSLPLVISERLTITLPTGIAVGPGAWYTLTFVQTFHYLFPANFGTWQVDNLSAPGGPGGGWAFSYSPCP